MPARWPKEKLSQATSRCYCAAHGCGDAIDKDGIYGVEVNARTLLGHRRADSARAYEIARNAQALALAKQEEETALATKTIALERQAAAASYSNKCNEDAGVTKTLDQISQIHARVLEIRKVVESIGYPTPSESTPDAVEDAMSKLLELREEAFRQYSSLRPIVRGAYRKNVSVATLAKHLKRDYEEVNQSIRSIEVLWETEEERHRAAMERFLSNGGSYFDSSIHFEDPLRHVKPLSQIVALMVIACSIILGLPRRGAKWLLSMVAFIVQTAVTTTETSKEAVGPKLVKLTSLLPLDIRASMDKFNLDGKSTVYASCPRCHKTYPPKPRRQPEDSIPTYKRTCNSLTFGVRCSERLVRIKTVNGQQIRTPIRPYVVFDMKDWLASLLSRKDYEKKMDGAWDRTVNPDGTLTDIFHGSVIQEFKGPDGKLFKNSGDPSAGRYLFSLGADSFNPLGNRAAGKKVSIAVLIMVCLNLPIEMRYKPENMFLAGIIPGPEEPPLTAGVNPYLDPLIDDLLLFWKGIFFSRTVLYPRGRLILCALIALICDLPAARKFSGFASHRHEFFCSVCWCSLTVHNYGHYDDMTWERRNDTECRAHADAFLTAETQKEASRSFNRSGLRYSTLLRLPYFDISKMVVVDPMHNLFLGLIKEHFQNILGYRPKPATRFEISPKLHISIPATDDNPPPAGKPAKASVRRLVAFLEQPFVETAGGFQAAVSKFGGPRSKTHHEALLYVAKGLDCLTPEENGSTRFSKLKLAKDIVAWRQRQENPTLDSIDSQRGNIFTEQEMQEIWNDVEQVIKPSWVSSVPANIASICPKLKSDQWRTVGALFLPITLIRLWSGVDRQAHERDQKRQELLHLTMLLCSAVAVATSRTTSETKAKLFMAQMSEYRSELARIFPSYSCHCNHHVALHIGEFLTGYGPVHGWWTFPFERMIGMLQRVQTNYKTGQYEQTIGRTWTRSSNLRAFFSKFNCPVPIAYCAEMFAQLSHPEARNSLSMNAVLDEQSELDEQDNEEDMGPDERVDSEVRDAFIRGFPGMRVPPRVHFFKRLTHEGIKFSSRETHEGNSGIMRKGSRVPYHIERFLRFPGHDKAWLLVRRFKEAEIDTDPYLAYPLLRAKMWDPTMELFLEVISIEDVDGHFAKCICPWGDKEVAVIVSLSRTY